MSVYSRSIRTRQLCVSCKNQRLTPSAKSSGMTICGTCRRRSGKGRRRFNKE